MALNLDLRRWLWWPSRMARARSPEIEAVRAEQPAVAAVRSPNRWCRVIA
jgi:hypothetical protein